MLNVSGFLRGPMSTCDHIGAGLSQMLGGTHTFYRSSAVTVLKLGDAHT